MTAKQDLGTAPLTAWELAEQSRAKLRLGADEPGSSAAETTIEGLLVDNLVPKSMLNVGAIKALLSEYVGDAINPPHDGDTYRVRLRGPNLPLTIIVPSTDLGLVADRKWPKEIDFPTDKLLDNWSTSQTSSTVYEVRIEVKSGTGNNWSTPPYVKLGVDRYQPYKNKQTDAVNQPTGGVFRSPLPGKDLDNDWLDRNTLVEVNIPVNYAFYRSDDQVEVFFSENYSQSAPSDLVFSGALPANGQVFFSVAGLTLQNKKYYLYYRLTDVSGNVSSVSRDQFIEVNVHPAAVLDKPKVPSAIKPDTLDLGDLKGTVVVEVTRPVNGLSNDKVEGFISDLAGTKKYSLGTRDLGSQLFLTFPMYYHEHLAPLFGDAKGSVEVMAYYEHKRGIQAARPSPQETFLLNFNYAGPISEELPSDTNKNMVNVTVIGASNVPNKLTAEDLKGAVYISTPMVEAGNGWKSGANERVFMWYGGKQVFQKNLEGDETELRATITREILEEVGSGIIKANWTIEYPNQPNRMSSQLQTVTVEEASVTFPPPTIPIEDGDVVNCEALGGDEESTDRWLKVEVDVDPLYMQNKVVVVRSIGTLDKEGLQPILGTEFYGPYTVGGAETEFAVDIKPYLQYIKPIQPAPGSGQPNGYIKVWYEVPVGGQTIPSASVIKEVDLIGDGHYCEGTPTRK
ncbi:hypothetical protein [Pseudomonas purpurea]|uniref:hypothetical protein n=1 Tax=Pseudomonas purpurea TaxID=3136737 RepID=UPI0032663909